MEILILVLTFVFTLLFVSYLTANVKVRDYDNYKDLVVRNIHNILAIGTNTALFLMFSNDLIKTFIESDLLSIFLVVYVVVFVFLILVMFFTNKIANKYAKNIVKIFTTLNILAFIVFYPFVITFRYLSKFFIFQDKEKMSEDEFLEIIEQAEELDGITQSESKLIKSVLDFDELKITDIYTPRIDIVGVNDKTSTKEITKSFINSGFSRLPIYNDDLDNIIGVINYKDFYTKVLLNKGKLESIIQKPAEVTEYMKVNDLLTLLKQNKSHMAIVKDEYGGTIGIVTMEDILEELVGDIFDEHDIVIENIKKVDDNRYIVLGSTYLDDLTETLNINRIETNDYLTVNGWVFDHLETVGKKGDTFSYNNLTVKVTKANKKQVLEVEITLNNLGDKKEE